MSEKLTAEGLEEIKARVPTRPGNRLALTREPLLALIATLEEAIGLLREDAAGVPVTTTLRIAADVLFEYGDGPLRDRLMVLAAHFDDLLARFPAPEVKG